MPQEKSLMQFAELESVDSLEMYIGQQASELKTPARSLTFISELDPLQLIEDSALTSFRTNIERRDEFAIIELTRLIERKQYENGVRKVPGTFYLLDHDEPEVFSAVTLSDKEFFELGVSRFIESLPYEISTSYLSTNDMRRLFDSLDVSVDGNVVITKAVVKSPSKKTEITYRDSPYFEVFSELEDEDYYIDKVQFEVRQGRHDFEGYVSRVGATRYTAGSVNVFFDYLLEDIGVLFSDKGELFKDKAREYGSRDADPIRIEYDEGSIIGVEENERLINTISSITNSSVTVYHRNPYVHASLLDFEDGSTIDIFLTSDREVALVPGFRSSRRTLSRVCDRITAGFREGTVVEGEKQQTSSPEEYFG